MLFARWLLKPDDGNWQFSAASQNGGIIVQRISIERYIENCRGGAITNKVEYREAWNVEAGKGWSAWGHNAPDKTNGTLA